MQHVSARAHLARTVSADSREAGDGAGGRGDLAAGRRGRGRPSSCMDTSTRKPACSGLPAIRGGICLHACSRASSRSRSSASCCLARSTPMALVPIALAVGAAGAACSRDASCLRGCVRRCSSLSLACQSRSSLAVFAARASADRRSTSEAMACPAFVLCALT